MWKPSVRISTLALAGYAWLAGCNAPEPGTPPPVQADLATPDPAPADLAAPPRDMTEPTIASGQYRATNAYVMGSCFSQPTAAELMGTYQVMDLGGRALSIKQVGAVSELCKASLDPDERFKNGVFLTDDNCQWSETWFCYAKPTATNQLDLEIRKKRGDYTARPGKTCAPTVSCTSSHFVTLVNP